MSSKKQQDFSSLTINQASLGAQVCVDNASRLMETAKLLSEKGFLEFATFAICTAIEEAGKAFLLIEYQENKFEGRDDAANTLNKAFYKHDNKLESAIFVLESDTRAFSRIAQIASQKRRREASVQEISRIMKKLRNIRIPDLKPQVKSTFETRNEMLYTEYKNGQFLAPKDKAKKSQFDQLVDIAEKIVPRAEFDLLMARACIERGSTRAQLAELLERELPTFIDVLRKRLRKWQRKTENMPRNSNR
jgi:AbiV family abortive infection protein